MTHPPRVGHAPAGDVLGLEAVAARSYPAVESEQLGGWLLRASGGWTGRGNSAVPLAVPEGDVLATLPAIERWYDDRGLPPKVALPHPPFGAVAGQLVERGWRPLHGALVLTTGCTQLLDAVTPRADLPAPVVADAPDAAWLAAHAAGRELPPQARQMLAGPDARFSTLVLDGRPAAIVRHVVDGPWVGIAAMAVVPERRRRGLARHLLRSVAADALAAGAERVWLQVDPTNEAGCALYHGAGFRLHHAYRYHERGDDAAQEL